MTTMPPLRRALVDLPVNTSTPPSLQTLSNSKRPQTGQKRPHWAIDEPENRVQSIRVRLSPEKTVSTPKKAGKACLPTSSTHPLLLRSQLTEEMGIPDRGYGRNGATTLLTSDRPFPETRPRRRGIRRLNTGI